MRIFLVPERGRRDFSCRVVNTPQQSQVGATAFQPVMLAAIDLQKHAGAGTPVTPRSVLGATMVAGTLDASVAEHTLDRCPRDDHPMVGLQFLCEVCLIEADVGGLCKIENRLSNIGCECVDWSVPTVPVGNSGRSLLAVRCKQATHLTFGQTKTASPLIGCHALSVHFTQDVLTLLVLLALCQFLLVCHVCQHRIDPGIRQHTMTYSLSSLHPDIIAEQLP
jgi:hypothetical protein